MEPIQYSKNQEVFGIETSHRLGLMHEISIKSFLEHGHTYTLYGIRKYENLPEGCQYIPLKPCIPDEIYKKITDRSPYLVSRLAQFYLLYMYGGFYVDSDIICLSDSIPSNTAYLDSTVRNSILPGAMKLPSWTTFAEKLIYSILRPTDIMEWDGRLGAYSKLNYPDKQDEQEAVLDPINIYAAATSTGLKPYCHHDSGPWLKDITSYRYVWFPPHSIYKKLLNRWGICMLIEQYWTDYFIRDASSDQAAYKFLQRKDRYSLMLAFIKKYCPDFDKNKIEYY